MKVNITSDSHWEAGVERILHRVYGRELSEYFWPKDYGSSINGIFIVVMCRDSDFRQRRRFSKKEKTLYLDVLLAFDKFKLLNPDQKKAQVLQEILSEISGTLIKYKFGDFDQEHFEKDFREKLTALIE